MNEGGMLEDNCVGRSPQEHRRTHRSCGLVSVVSDLRAGDFAWLDVAAPHLDPGLSQRLKFTYDGRRHECHWGGGPQLPKSQRECPAEGHPAAPSFLWGSRRHLLPQKVEKWGFLVPFQESILAPALRAWSALAVLGHFGKEEGKGLQCQCRDAMVLPHHLGRVKGRVLSSPPGSHPCPRSHSHAGTCWVLPGDFCWIFFGPNAVLRKDSSMLALEKNSSLLEFTICLSMARRTCLEFHHTVLQLQKLFIVGTKIEALPFRPFSVFFSPSNASLWLRVRLCIRSSSSFFWWA